jgi:DNA-binding CsgD family transcriptional regulator
VHLHRGDLAAAGDALARGDALVASGGLQFGIDWFVLARALYSEATGDAGEAFAMLRAAWEAASGLQVAAGLTTFGPDLVRLARDADPDLAAIVVERLEQIARRHPDDVVAQGRCRRATGLLGRDVGALRAAADAFDVLQHRFEAATVRLEAAELAASDDDAVTRDAEAAVAVFDVLGTPREARRAAALLARLGRRRATSPRSVTGWDALTPTELEVVDEVCGGRSNSEVALRLGVSRRTVEAHLRSVYRKLDVKTRLALAVASTERERAGSTT